MTLKENTHYLLLKCINDCKINLVANQLGLNPTHLKAYTESFNKDRFKGLLIDNHISSDIRKVSKICDNFVKGETPGLYIMNEKFEYYHSNDVLKYIEGVQGYYLDFSMLKDKCIS